MMVDRPLFSICIPAYNRARHLPELLNSIFAQDETDFEVVICEDRSPERPLLASIVSEFQKIYGLKIRYFENEENLGFDANIRKLVSLSCGSYCFFMGNDDVLCPEALSRVADIVMRHPDVGFILRSYAWFDATPDKISGEVRYFDQEKVFAAGSEAIRICFRRSGVISGYIVKRDLAQAVATDRFDGSLYYQMHLTASVLVDSPAVFTPHVLVLCRNSEPPDFGQSVKEKGRYTPGRYTPEARLSMVSGALSIVEYLRQAKQIDLVDPITRDYANYFYPYIRDQLQLPVREYLRLYRGYLAMGFGSYPLFHVYFVICYVLKQKGFDFFVKQIRSRLGRTPHLGLSK